MQQPSTTQIRGRWHGHYIFSCGTQVWEPCWENKEQMDKDVWGPINWAEDPAIHLLQKDDSKTHHWDHGFKMWLIHDKTAASERFLSWPNHVFAAIWNTVSALEQFFHIAAEIAIATETAFKSLIEIDPDKPKNKHLSSLPFSQKVIPYIDLLHFI